VPAATSRALFQRLATTLGSPLSTRICMTLLSSLLFLHAQPRVMHGAEAFHLQGRHGRDVANTSEGYLAHRGGRSVTLNLPESMSGRMMA
jgi:hypothetical protein